MKAALLSIGVFLLGSCSSVSKMDDATRPGPPNEDVAYFIVGSPPDIRIAWRRVNPTQGIVEFASEAIINVDKTPFHIWRVRDVSVQPYVGIASMGTDKLYIPCEKYPIQYIRLSRGDVVYVGTLSFRETATELSTSWSFESERLREYLAKAAPQLRDKVREQQLEAGSTKFPCKSEKYTVTIPIYIPSRR